MLRYGIVYNISLLNPLKLFLPLLELNFGIKYYPISPDFMNVSQLGANTECRLGLNEKSRR